MPVRQAERRPVRIQLHGGDMPEKVPESRQAKQLGAGLDAVDPGRVQPVHAEPFDFRSCRDQLMKQPAERLIPVAGLPAQGVFFGAVPAEAAELEGFPVLFIPGDSLLYTPCIAAIAAVKREMGNKWAISVVLWQCFVAWMAAYLVRAIGLLLGIV